ncbi:hypothetical protein C8R46DRAFT_614960 [Mycena filopes]|nr:hypothetical protein C8R46DRAFT_614960 [Mycena filopes]
MWVGEGFLLSFFRLDSAAGGGGDATQTAQCGVGMTCALQASDRLGNEPTFRGEDRCPPPAAEADVALVGVQREPPICCVSCVRRRGIVGMETLVLCVGPGGREGALPVRRRGGVSVLPLGRLLRACMAWGGGRTLRLQVPVTMSASCELWWGQTRLCLCDEPRGKRRAGWETVPRGGRTRALRVREPEAIVNEHLGKLGGRRL